MACVASWFLTILVIGGFCQVTINNPSKDGPKSFTFDAVYDIDTQQKHFYEESCYQLIESVMDGFNGTIFAYGQTGCGKTWTMQGLTSPPELRGVIPHSFDHIFQNIKADPATQWLVRCSYLEV
jgi:kinesin family protein 3/17